MIISLLEKMKMVFSDGRNITQINVSLIADVTNLIEVLNGIEGKI